MKGVGARCSNCKSLKSLCLCHLDKGPDDEEEDSDLLEAIRLSQEEAERFAKRARLAAGAPPPPAIPEKPSADVFAKFPIRSVASVTKTSTTTTSVVTMSGFTKVTTSSFESSTNSTTLDPESFAYVDETNINEDLLCPVCFDPFIDPVFHGGSGRRNISCRHTFCRPCIKDLKECPMCRGVLQMTDVIQVPRIVTNLLDNLLVKCQNCDAEHTRGKHASHICGDQPSIPSAASNSALPPLLPPSVSEKFEIDSDDGDSESTEDVSALKEFQKRLELRGKPLSFSSSSSSSSDDEDQDWLLPDDASGKGKDAKGSMFFEIPAEPAVKPPVKPTFETTDERVERQLKNMQRLRELFAKRKSGPTSSPSSSPSSSSSSSASSSVPFIPPKPLPVPAPPSFVPASGKASPLPRPPLDANKKPLPLPPCFRFAAPASSSPAPPFPPPPPPPPPPAAAAVEHDNVFFSSDEDEDDWELKKLPEESGYVWNCAACTLENPPDVFICRACGSAKGSFSVCPACTFANKKGAKKCGVCETAL